MLRVTAIEKAKRKGYHLFVEDEYALTVSAEVLAETGLRAGQEISLQRLDEIRELCDRRRARERALYLLEARSHSEKELFDKLCKSVPEEIAADVTHRMVELGLIDDAAYARRWAAMLWREKKHGPRRIRQGLMQKGFSRDLIDEVLEEMEESFGNDEAAQQLDGLIRRKYARYLVDGDPKGRNKAVNGLLRLGYDYEQIRLALRNFSETEE
ncbi:MAG: RecX family transcriptional regulator [Oscillospiraceae bacterium]|nr:RecX family transcriptional regulator [Oscillospiraceae bacterium]